MVRGLGVNVRTDVRPLFQKIVTDPSFEAAFEGNDVARVAFGYVVYEHFGMKYGQGYIATHASRDLYEYIEGKAASPYVAEFVEFIEARLAINQPVSSDDMREILKLANDPKFYTVARVFFSKTPSDVTFSDLVDAIRTRATARNGDPLSAAEISGFIDDVRDPVFSIFTSGYDHIKKVFKKSVKYEKFKEYISTFKETHFIKDDKTWHGLAACAFIGKHTDWDIRDLITSVRQNEYEDTFKSSIDAYYPPIAAPEPSSSGDAESHDPRPTDDSAASAPPTDKVMEEADQAIETGDHPIDDDPTDDEAVIDPVVKVESDAEEEVPRDQRGAVENLKKSYDTGVDTLVAIHMLPSDWRTTKSKKRPIVEYLKDQRLTQDTHDTFLKESKEMLTRTRASVFKVDDYLFPKTEPGHGISKAEFESAVGSLVAMGAVGGYTSKQFMLISKNVLRYTNTLREIRRNIRAYISKARGAVDDIEAYIQYRKSLRAAD